jgi:glutathione S-transferase
MACWRCVRSFLQPKDLRQRARMYQWISAVGSYYCPYMSYHLSHERLIYPALGITPDEKVVAHALPRIAMALDVMERELEQEREYLIGDQGDAQDPAEDRGMARAYGGAARRHQCPGERRTAHWQAR